MNALFGNIIENKKWITEDLEEVNIESMPTETIKACIHKIYKSNGNWRREYLRIFEDELRKRKWKKQDEQF